jgi:DNA polymerase
MTQKIVTRESFIKKWKSCQLCPLGKDARNHVLFRGSIPAEVLFIGEAPGKTEDKLGKPFIGPSGQLLSTALLRLGLSSYCITNVVCCIPWRNYLKDSIRRPSKEEARTCSPHIAELVSLCKPKLIGLLGNEAKERFITPISKETKVVGLRHPAYILRNGGVDSLEFKRFLASLSQALDEVNVAYTNPFQLIGA